MNQSISQPMSNSTRASYTRRKLLLAALVAWTLVMLFPIAMNGKGCSVITYFLLVSSIALFAVKRSLWTRRLVAALSVCFVATFILPLDLVVGEGDSFKLLWQRETPEGSVYGRHRSHVLGVKPLWVLQVVIPGRES